MLLDDQTFSSSPLNANPRSTTNFMAEIKRCGSDFQYGSH